MSVCICQRFWEGPEMQQRWKNTRNHKERKKERNMTLLALDQSTTKYIYMKNK
jgi:hypothetical protein